MSTDGRDYLCIENPGFADVRLLMVIGASDSRGREGQIGQFGSGTPQSVALGLRKGLEPMLFSSMDGYTFGTEAEYGSNARGSTTAINTVVMQQVTGSSKRKTKLGFDVGMGALAWTDAGMAVREFLSNAVDAVHDTTGNYEDIKVTFVSAEDRKPREGYTRVYLYITDEVRDYLDNLKVNFLVFNRGWDKSQVFLDKPAKNSPLRIYRRGVLVYEDPYNRTSLNDYNFEDIYLNEDRTIPEYHAREAVAKALKYGTAEQIRPWLEAIRDNQSQYFEVSAIDGYTLSLRSGESTSTVRAVAERWSSAFRDVFGEQGLVVDTEYGEEGVRRKGYTPAKVSPAFRQALASFGLATADKVLTHDERLGREVFDLPAEVQDRMKRIWGKLEVLGVTAGRKMPRCVGFKTMMDAKATTEAYYDPATDVVGMSADIYNDTGFKFVMGAIEEYGHAITRAADETRDLQDWCLRVAGMLLHESGF